MNIYFLFEYIINNNDIELTFIVSYDIIVIPKEKSLTGVPLNCEREFKRNI